MNKREETSASQLLWGSRERGRVSIPTDTVTKLTKGKLVESEVGSALWIRKAETVPSAIHTESVNRERGRRTLRGKNTCHRASPQDSRAAAVEQLARTWWGRERRPKG